jgi:Ca2+-dependent lipid-binding protein
MKSIITITILAVIFFTSCEKVESKKRGVEVSQITITSLNMDWSDDTILEGDPDPFIRYSLNGSVLGETDHQVGSEAPVEYQTQITLNHSQSTGTVVFEIYDHDNVGDNDYMGAVTWNPEYHTENEILTVAGETNTLELELHWIEE